MTKHFFYSDLFAFKQVDNILQYSRNGGPVRKEWVRENFYRPQTTKRGNLYTGGTPNKKSIEFITYICLCS